MVKFVVHSAAEQVVAHLRSELRRGRWREQMPGGDRMAAELGIGRATVEAALKQLEQEGLLVNQGLRRGRLIVPVVGADPLRRLRVAILIPETADRRLDYIVELERELALAGHTVIADLDCFSEWGRTLVQTTRMVEATEADAWLVCGGSDEILRWFVAWDKPVLAIFGRRRGLPIASVGPDKPPVMAEMTQRLVMLGHRRIVLMVRRMRRLPNPGATEQAFLDALVAAGISPSDYHLPDWEESVEGYHARLESLFQVTPPTALLVDGGVLFVAALQFLATKGLRVPKDVSLVSLDYDASFELSWPRISHIAWDSRPVVERVMNWAENVSLGIKDVQQTLTRTEFVVGGTIAVAKTGK
jgi:DNA-binding LacI/PurR family transcriptional regulator/biotin operon repressor